MKYIIATYQQGKAIARKIESFGEMNLSEAKKTIENLATQTGYIVRKDYFCYTDRIRTWGIFPAGEKYKTEHHGRPNQI